MLLIMDVQYKNKICPEKLQTTKQKVKPNPASNKLFSGGGCLESHYFFKNLVTYLKNMLLIRDVKYRNKKCPEKLQTTNLYVET